MDAGAPIPQHPKVGGRRAVIMGMLPAIDAPAAFIVETLQAEGGLHEAHITWLRGLQEVALRTGVPVSFGLLTTDTVEQAIDRAGGTHGNKGADAALAAVQMVKVLYELDQEAGGDAT